MTHLLRRSVVVVGLLLVAGSAADAQVCVGLPSLTNAAATIGVDASFADGVKGVGTSVVAGRDQAFASAGVGYVSYDENSFDANATSFGGTVGTSVAPSQTSSLRICPLASVAYQYGPNLDTDFGRLKLSVLSGFAGLGLGGSVEVSPGFSLVPFARGGLLVSRLKMAMHGESESSSDTGGLVGGGLSLVFNNTFAIVPEVSIPLGFDENDPIFSIGLAFSIGRRR